MRSRSNRNMHVVATAYRGWSRPPGAYRGWSRPPGAYRDTTEINTFVHTAVNDSTKDLCSWNLLATCLTKKQNFWMLSRCEFAQHQLEQMAS